MNRKLRWRTIVTVCMVEAIPMLSWAGDGCECPAPCTPPSCVTPRDLPAEPRGVYVRAPETGEQAGESVTYGVRGPGLRLPAISIDLPELRLPSLVKYRRNPEMQVEATRAPWVEGRAMEYNQIPPSNPRDIDDVQPRDFTPQCVPPTPACSARERELMDKLAQREAELQHVTQRFGQLEAVVNQLAERQAAQAAEETLVIRPSSYQEPVRTAPAPKASQPVKRTTAPPPSAPVPRPVPVRQTLPVNPPVKHQGFGLSTASQEEEGFGAWNGAAKR